MSIIRNLLLLTVLVAAGCSGGETVYRPHHSPDEFRAKKPEPAGKSAPKPLPEGTISAVEPAGAIDLTSYGLDFYPGSTLDTKTTMRLKGGPGDRDRVKVTLDAPDDPPKKIASFYKDRIKATSALGSIDFATVEGTSNTGNPVSIVIGTLNEKTTITFTIFESPKK